MPQVSKYLVEKDIEERMFEVFWQTIADLKSKKSVYNFFSELLTHTEQIMLAKRLAIAIMLVKEYDYRTISETLRVSTATVMRVNSWFREEDGEYEKVVQKIIRKEKVEEFFDSLEEKVSQIIPPRRGADWSKLKSKEWRDRRDRRYKRGVL